MVFHKACPGQDLAQIKQLTTFSFFHLCVRKVVNWVRVRVRVRVSGHALWKTIGYIENIDDSHFAVGSM